MKKGELGKIIIEKKSYIKISRQEIQLALEKYLEKGGTIKKNVSPEIPLKDPKYFKNKHTAIDEYERENCY